MCPEVPQFDDGVMTDPEYDGAEGHEAGTEAFALSMPADFEEGEGPTGEEVQAQIIEMQAKLHQLQSIVDEPQQSGEPLSTHHCRTANPC